VAVINPTLPTIGDSRGGEEADVRAALAAILTELNGNLDGANLKDNSLTGDELLPALAEALGINETGIVRRGKSIIATEESRTNAAFGTLPTADQVQNLVLPSGGLFRITFQGMWKESVAGAARAAIFIGANQFKIADQQGPGPQVEAARTDGTNANIYRALASAPFGLASGNAGGGAYPGDATTGQAVGLIALGGSKTFWEVNGAARGTGTDDLPVGGEAIVFADPGTYTVSIQFKASSGSVTAKNRKLQVEAIGY
jgi:hypothetical protein